MTTNKTASTGALNKLTDETFVLENVNYEKQMSEAKFSRTISFSKTVKHVFECKFFIVSKTELVQPLVDLNTYYKYKIFYKDQIGSGASVITHVEPMFTNGLSKGLESRFHLTDDRQFEWVRYVIEKTQVHKTPVEFITQVSEAFLMKFRRKLPKEANTALMYAYMDKRYKTSKGEF